jgi:transcription elongation GreA/GreB family factor
MAVPQDIRKAIEKQDTESIEDRWLAHVAEAPADLDFFVGVARALSGVAEDERARFLLEMLDEALRSEERWETRLALLRRAGSLLLEPEDLHPAILETLEALHGDTPSFEGLVRAVRLDKAPHDLDKAWEKADRLRELVPFDVGTVVRMEGKGAGRVVEVNFELEAFKVDFEGHAGLSVGFRAAPKMLEVLPPGHVLRRKREEPAALAALAQGDPPALLRLVLESFGRPLTAGEVREAVSGVVPEGRWTAWWGVARKHPQVVARGAGARQTYSWLASEGHAVEAVEKRFGALDPRAKIALYRKEAAREPELARRMAAELARLAREEAATDPGLAFEISLALDGALEGAGGGEGPRPEELVRETAAPKELLAGIEDRSARERALALAREHREDWIAVWVAHLGRETEPRLLDLLADALAAEAPQELYRFTDGVAGQPARSPAVFTWIAERAASDPDLRSRTPLRLLEQILGALVDRRFAPFKMRLVRLAESGGTVPKLLDHLEARHAPRAEEAIHKAAGLEPYQRDALTNAVHLRFPALRAEEEDASRVIYSTPEAIEARRRELRDLMRQEIPANRKAIEEARAMGDLRENFEYKAARQRHEYLSSRQAQLEGELGLARPIDAAKVDPSQVRIGTRVELAEVGGEGRSRTITILGPWDSKPEEDVLAYESDLAKALLGKAPGDRVEAGGDTWEVRDIRRYTDA